jgi:glycosyltransferase involved in cell wall biosynthesis
LSPADGTPVTLVLVSYHKADVIGRVIDSAVRGSVVPDLLVVSDDGSSDGTPDAAEEAARRAGIPYRILRHQRAARYRLQTMRNSGIAHALDGLVIVSDSDCVFGEHTIESHLAIHREHPMAVGSGPRYEYLSGQSGPFTSMYTTLEFAHFPRANYLVPFGANLAFPKRLWRELGGFDRSYEGSYGLDDHEFCARAEQAGAVCVSDPGAYLVHCPHDTIFGGRHVDKNWVLFKATLGRDFGHEQRAYLTDYVVPWYWRGNRKTPLLGKKLALDRFGAPAGFVPPLHLHLAETLDPLIVPVARAVDTKSAAEVDRLKRLAQRLNPDFVPRTSPLQFLLSHLRHVFATDRDHRTTLAELREWLVRARSFATAPSPALP